MRSPSSKKATKTLARGDPLRALALGVFCVLGELRVVVYVKTVGRFVVSRSLVFVPCSRAEHGKETGVFGVLNGWSGIIEGGGDFRRSQGCAKTCTPGLQLNRAIGQYNLMLGGFGIHTLSTL